MYTIDASVHVNALNPYEANSVASQALLTVLHDQQIPLFNPTLLVVEVAAAIVRNTGNAEQALALSTALLGLSHQTLIPLDDALTDRAAALAVAARLRGADPVYAAVAQAYGTTLVTLEIQQLERLSPVLRTIRPGDALAELESG